MSQIFSWPPTECLHEFFGKKGQASGNPSWERSLMCLCLSDLLTVSNT